MTTSTHEQLAGLGLIRPARLPGVGDIDHSDTAIVVKARTGTDRIAVTFDPDTGDWAVTIRHLRSR